MNGKIRSIFMSVTYNCNQRCKFCYAVENVKRAMKHGDLNTLREIIFSTAESRYVEKTGVIHLTGGEPTIHPQILEIIREIKDNTNYKVNLITNGIALSDIKFVSKLMECGLDAVQVSIEGLSDIHEKITGLPGSWEKCLSGLKNVSEYSSSGVSIATNTTICSLNIEEVKDLTFFIIETLNIERLAFNRITPDVWQRNKLYSVTYSLTINLLEELKLIRDTHDVELRYLMPLPLCLVRNRNILPIGGCGAARSLINIDPDGNLTPCPQFADRSLGNILKDNFDEIWKDNQYLSYIRNLNYLPPNCKKCALVNQCRGACPICWMFEKDALLREISFDYDHMMGVVI